MLDPRPVFLPLDFIQLPVALNELGFYAGLLVKAAVDPSAAAAFGGRAAEFYADAPDENLAAETHRELFSTVIQALRASRRPVIVCGTDIAPPQIPGLTADLTLLLQAAGKKAGLFYVLPGANAYGAGLASDPQRSFLQIVEGIENGEIKALILAECDPFKHFADRQRLERAIDQLEALVVMDYLPTEAVDRAHLFIPTATLYEAGGVFINQEGRLQVARQAYKGGLSIVASGGGDRGIMVRAFRRQTLVRPGSCWQNWPIKMRGRPMTGPGWRTSYPRSPICRHGMIYPMTVYGFNRLPLPICGLEDQTPSPLTNPGARKTAWSLSLWNRRSEPKNFPFTLPACRNWRRSPAPPCTPATPMHSNCKTATGSRSKLTVAAWKYYCVSPKTWHPAFC